MKGKLGLRPWGLSAVLACALVCVLVVAGGAGANSDQGLSRADALVEIKLADRAAIDRLMADAEAIDAEFNDHYLRENDDGTLGVQVLGSEEQIAELRAQGYEVTGTIEDHEDYLDRIAERTRAIELERRAHAFADGKKVDLQQYGMRAGIVAAALDREIVVNRVDYFENYAGRFLSVEAWNRDTKPTSPNAGSGPTMALTWDSGAGTEIGSGGGPKNMAPYIDPDPALDHYLYHRILVRVGAPGDSNPPRPSKVRIASSSGASEVADVQTWMGGGLPPHAAGFMRGFHNRYMDPTEVYQRFDQLAAEFPNLTQQIPLPFKTRGYQRKAQATMAPLATALAVAAAPAATGIRVASTAGITAGMQLTINPGTTQEVRTVASVVSPNPASPNANVTLSSPLTLAHVSGASVYFSEQAIGNTAAAAAAPAAVVLTTKAWGHLGGNDTTAEFRHPGAASSPLSVSVAGRDLVVSLATDATGRLTSTAADVVAAINGNANAAALLSALTYRGNAGAGIVQPRTKTNLSDFLAVSMAVPASGIPHDNSHVQRGPFQPELLRIGRERSIPGNKVGVYLFCQQHAREWVTPITCVETAEELLRNYAIDPQTRDLVDNLDIFILPSVNPDGAHHSFYNFQSQRRNMRNYCVEDEETWTPRINPSTGTPFTNTDPASRNSWGVDLNRNQSVGTIFDGYVGASLSCTSDVFAGPSEVSEAEAKNEKWIVDTFSNIKFSNNIHTSGGYFMWAPGAYKPDRETLPPPNLGIERYFFAAADTVLNRIKEYRGNVVLPGRTGPIADVLYSAAGNSADDNFYRKGIIGYSFEAGSDLFVNPTLSAAAAAGADRIRISSLTGIGVGDTITVEYGGANPETRRIQEVITPTPANPNPNVVLSAPLTQAHAAGVQINGGTQQQGVGFFPNYATEGRHEANEFAAGNFGLLESAIAYARDRTPPQVDMTGVRISRDPIETTFRYVNEPSVIYYTLDGSTPTTSSPTWDRQGLRRPGEVFEFTQTTTVRWLALDIAGNQSTGSIRFAVDTVAPVTSADVRGGQGAGASVVFLSADDGPAGAGVAKTEYRVNGGAWQRYTGAFVLNEAGTYKVDFYSTDLAGNAETPKSTTVEVIRPTRPRLAPCGLGVRSGKLRAGQRTLVRATVKVGGAAYRSARVSLRGPGIAKTARTTSNGVASAWVRPARPGTLRVSVRGDVNTLGCSASRRIAKGAVRGASTGGAALTGRTR